MASSQPGTGPQRAGFASATDRGLLVTAASTVVSRQLIREIAELRDAAARAEAAGSEAALGPSGLTPAAKKTLKQLRVVAAYRPSQIMPMPPLPGVARNVVLDYEIPKTLAEFELASGGTTEFVFIVAPTNPNRMAQFKNLLDLCIRSARPSRGTRYIVFLSALQPSTGKSGFSSGEVPAYFKAFLEMERMVQKSGIPSTILRCALPLNHVVFDWVKGAASLAQDPDEPITFRLPIGNGTFPSVASRTIARISAHLFLSFPNPFINRTIDVAGPEILSGVSIASSASRGLGGVPIRFSTCTREEFVKFLIAAGLAKAPWNVENIMAVLDMVAEGRFDRSSGDAARELFGIWYGKPAKRIADVFVERKEVRYFSDF